MSITKLTKNSSEKEKLNLFKSVHGNSQLVGSGPSMCCSMCCSYQSIRQLIQSCWHSSCSHYSSWTCCCTCRRCWESSASCGICSTKTRMPRWCTPFRFPRRWQWKRRRCSESKYRRTDPQASRTFLTRRLSSTTSPSTSPVDVCSAASEYWNSFREIIRACWRFKKSNLNVSRIVELILERWSLLDGNGIRLSRELLADHLKVATCQHLVANVGGVAQECKSGSVCRVSRRLWETFKLPITFHIMKLLTKLSRAFNKA